jgi:hypothetical protein
MIFLLGGRKNPAVRAVVGALLLVAGIVIHDGAIFIALGAVLIIWGGALALKAHRISRQAQITGDRLAA